MESDFYIAFTINKFQTHYWKWRVFRKPGLSEWLLMNIKGFISEHTEERVSTERKSYFRTLSVLHEFTELADQSKWKKCDLIKTI